MTVEPRQSKRPFRTPATSPGYPLIASEKAAIVDVLSRGIGPACAGCGHGEGHHRFGYAADGSRRIEDWTPCQCRDCDCAGFSEVSVDG